MDTTEKNKTIADVAEGNNTAEAELTEVFSDTNK
jgi:hypothetical protein